MRESERAPRRIAVGITGSSGFRYGVALVDSLCALGFETHVVLSGPAFKVARLEEGYEVDPARSPDEIAEKLFADPSRVRIHSVEAVESIPSSGSSGVEAMVVCPCSMGTLARIAHGYSIGLIERAADVALKEGRPLVLVPRETPLSVLHLENMIRLARAGAIVLPASPGFYHRPRRISDLVAFVVAKILGRLGLEIPEELRWSGPSESLVEEEGP